MKNIRPLAGKPLVAHAGDIVRLVPSIDRAVVSTDHPEIRKIAEESGLEAPFLRPESLSGDRIGDLEVLVHALESSEKHYGTKFDAVVMLQPTSPLRLARDVTATIDKLFAEELDSVWTVSPVDLKYHPLKILGLEEGKLDFFDERGRGIIARQQLRPVYYRNGASYAITRECLLEQRSIMGRNSGAVVIEDYMVSIDTLEDFARVEELWGQRAE